MSTAKRQKYYKALSTVRLLLRGDDANWGDKKYSVEQCESALRRVAAWHQESVRRVKGNFGIWLGPWRDQHRRAPDAQCWAAEDYLVGELKTLNENRRYLNGLWAMQLRHAEQRPARRVEAQMERARHEECRRIKAAQNRRWKKEKAAELKQWKQKQQAAKRAQKERDLIAKKEQEQRKQRGSTGECINWMGR